MNARLRRFWFKFEGHRDSPLGYGVTAWTEEDAAAILIAKVFEDGSLPSASITRDVKIPTLDAGHIIPNMADPTLRGIWYPRGFAF